MSLFGTPRDTSPATVGNVLDIAAGLVGQFPPNWLLSGPTLSFQYGWQVAQAYGALPQQYPVGATLLGGGNTMPILFRRYSSVPRIS